MKKKLFSKLLWGILAGVFAVFFTAAAIGSWYAFTFGSAAINMAFGESDFITVNDPDAKPIYPFKSDYATQPAKYTVTDKDGNSTTVETDENIWSDGETLWQEDKVAIKDAVAEGATLLWNKKVGNANALPLADGNQVSLFGIDSVSLFECGSGSGFVTTHAASKSNPQSYSSTDLKTAFTGVGLGVNDTLWNLYSTGAGKTYLNGRTNPQAACTEGQTWKINEAPWSVVSSAQSSFSSFNNAAIVVLGRMGGEYSDLHYSSEGENTAENGGVLALTTQEKELLQNVTALRASGTFEKVVLLLNTANPVKMQDINAYADNIDACMWIGQTGSTGAEAVADILVGKTNPSGRMPDTYAYDLNSAPSTVNDGSYTWGNDSLLSWSGTKAKDNKYIVYQEGIYVGYRYYETRYSDLIEGKNFADSTKGVKLSSGGWDYEKEVAFPFGYGLSYTTFEYSKFNAVEDGNNYKVTVTVTNTGSVAGKETVQVYLQKPYTQYDVTNQIEKAAIELAGFAKTDILEPGKSETVEVNVPKEYFKTYDANNKKTYIIEAGDYYLTVGTDAHVALNNILVATNNNKGMGDVTQSVMCGNVKEKVLGESFTKKFTLKDDFTTYSKSKQTGMTITNQLDSGDINKYENAGDNSVQWLTRSDWNSYPTAAAVLTLNEAISNDLKYNNDPDNDGYEMPTYDTYVSGTHQTGNAQFAGPNIDAGDLNAFKLLLDLGAPLNPELEVQKNDVFGDGQLKNMVYDDGLTYVEHWNNLWNQLLDQMTWDEQALLAANAYHQLQGAPSVGLPVTKQENGPVGVADRSISGTNFPLPQNQDDFVFVTYPNQPLLAATFNVEIIESIGRHMGEDLLYTGYNGIYAPGANMHRSPYGGRAYEYGSEDSYLTGIVAAYLSKGIESKGSMAYVKHFALNDMETNRRHVSLWSNEQASREIYLRAFEIAFTDGGASATMNSFTRIGTRWNGSCKAMMTTILREEWGWDGINITDWMTDGAMSYVDAVLAGTNSFDGNGTKDKFNEWKSDAAVAQALRESSKIIIYNVVNSNAMNGKTISSHTVPNTPGWRTAIWAVDYTLGALLVISAGMLVASFVVGAKSKPVAADGDSPKK